MDSISQGLRTLSPANVYLSIMQAAFHHPILISMKPFLPTDDRRIISLDKYDPSLRFAINESMARMETLVTRDANAICSLDLPAPAIPIGNQK